MNNDRLVGEFDASKWAEAFVETVWEHPEIPGDIGTMTTWFANAIMAGYDHGWKDAAERSATWGDFLHSLEPSSRPNQGGTDGSL